MKPARYFAFGSNMCSTRLAARVSAAHAMGPAALGGWRFACNKRGTDGSAKANLIADPDAVVWGVVYEVPAPALERLDRFEGGYRRIAVEVAVPGEGEVVCHTYVAERVTSRLALRSWYKRHIVSGADEHALPTTWCKMLRALPIRAD